MEEKPGQPQPQHHHSHHHPHHHPQQQQQQQPHHHHHYYFYNHNHNHHHHHHHQQPHQYLQHGAEGSPKAQPKPLKHEQKHTLQQHQETPKKKTGYGEINGNAGEREISLKSLSSDDATNPISRVLNGNQQVVDTSLKQTVKAGTFGKAGIKTKNFIQKNSMDKKNGKSYENKSGESQSVDKTDAIAIPNGVITNNSGYITNGYMGRGADNDGSGSESGYTTPKKRKARRNSAKGCENLNLVQDKIMQQETSVTTLKQGLETFKPDYSEQKGNRVDGSKPIWKYETGPGGTSRGKPAMGDLLRKSSDIKPGMSSKKFDDRPKGKHASAAASKEDSWTLFKPPPVFPVDNSSAKIVPKISYASKVKENLNKTIQNSSVSPSSSSSSSSSTGETQTQPSSRLSQVPMSALKSVTSANFSNGPVLAGTDTNLYPGAQPLLTTAANTLTPISSGTDSVLQDMSLTSAAVEQIKSSLFIYPSNMQTVLLSTAQVDLPSQTDQQNLGDIFQNQWGLSFINEPSAGPETVIGKSSDHKVMEVTFQGEYPATLVSQGAEIIPSGTEHPVFPKAYELEKRTSPQVLGSILKPGTASESGALSLESSHIGDLQKADTSSQGALVFLSKDYEIENQNPLASPTNTSLGSAKEQKYQRGLERNDSWGSFDPRAAIVYHTKEMESIWNLQKQDPKRIITYNEAMDSPDQ
ncbi:nuclear fragile X mental retardation-interacting protein 2 [Perognathus longimembris pacificus]|uniref:nuclear fragile X mental retardation-interacting protein 2 n=1 Tax=Perognathus longimembris pacificus TaxID=214514 RepID=UPI002019F01D|nr:nuclear fragile X mental retardation-interacting protein 2 [Perognathus longimembris pacificus]